jgi:hypothetical protein
MKGLVIYLVGIITLTIGLSHMPASGQPARTGGTITVVIPPEPVLREGVFMVAKEVTGTVTIRIDGRTYTGTLTFPDTKVRRTGVGRMMVDSCTATGEIK